MGSPVGTSEQSASSETAPTSRPSHAWIERRLAQSLAILGGASDIIEGRVDDGEIPVWAEVRGWTAFLLALPAAAVERGEHEGLRECLMGTDGAPPTLRAFAEAIAESVALPRIEAERSTRDASLTPHERRSVPARKRAQLEALLDHLGPLVEGARRLVEVGAGRGHLARIAHRRSGRPTIGLEREAARVETARRLALGDGPTFVATDALAGSLDVGPGDLLLGLHACGDLGDFVVTEAARTRCDVALVSCCPQKIAAPTRSPLSSAAARAAFRPTRGTLGLANFVAATEGVERTTRDTLASRRERLALRLLLRARGVAVAPGEEMRGVNRRTALRGLSELATVALIRRGLQPATDDELVACRSGAAERFARVRRLSLPRNALGRLLEVAIVLDRAARLVEAGHLVQAGVAWERSTSPRDLLIVARAPRR